jgi:hypothetical protein
MIFCAPASHGAGAGCSSLWRRPLVWHLLPHPSVLLYFQSVYDLGPSLAYQLLLIILLTFLSMLLFSNLITALSTFFSPGIWISSDPPRFRRPLLLLAPDHYDFKFLLDGAFLACRSLQPTARSLAANFFYLWLAIVLPLF